MTPANPSIAAGASQQFSATGTYSDASTANLTGSVTWASATPAVATISATGLATGLAPGTQQRQRDARRGQRQHDPDRHRGDPPEHRRDPGQPVDRGRRQPAVQRHRDVLRRQHREPDRQRHLGLGHAGRRDDQRDRPRDRPRPGHQQRQRDARRGQRQHDPDRHRGDPPEHRRDPGQPVDRGRGASQQFSATGTYSDASTANLTGSVTWASATPAVATINATGLATGLAPGTSTISATLGAVSGSTTLTVTAATLQSIAVTPANPSIAAGASQQFSATGTYSDASTANVTGSVTWASATPAVATINATGLATGLAPGTHSISATLGAVSGSTTLTVTAATLQSIAVTPANPSIAAGASQQFSATGTYSDASTANLTGSVTWASATPAVATISADRPRDRPRPGHQHVSATLGAVSGSTTLTVTAATSDTTPPTLTTPVVSPNPAVAGTLITVTSTATDPSGVASAQFSVDGGPWDPMRAADGAFGGTSEGLAATFGGSVAQIATGYSHTCALLANRTVECWGSNAAGQLGDGTLTNRRTPVIVAGLSSVTAIAAGIHTCALLADTTVRCWGSNTAGELGNGTISQNSPTPVAVTGLTGVTAIGIGQHDTCALLADGSVRCWGFNGLGSSGTARRRAGPSRLRCPALAARRRSPSAAITHAPSLLIPPSGAGATTRPVSWAMARRRPGSTPVAVTGLSGVIALASGDNAGDDQTCALLTGGTVKCWGSNFSGQLGDGTTTDRLAPTLVSGLSGATAITAGASHTCALLATGAATCWGQNIEVSSATEPRRTARPGPGLGSFEHHRPRRWARAHMRPPRKRHHALLGRQHSRRAWRRHDDE